MSKVTLSFVTPPAEKLQNFFGVFLQFQIGVDTFSGKVFCENCGKSFTRKIICPGMARENVIWICRTTHQKGKALCPAKHYTEAVMEQVAAEVMGLPEFDPAAFEKKMQEIRVQMDGSLIYIFRDGHQISRDWEDIPRRMKKKERGLVSCQQ